MTPPAAAAPLAPPIFPPPLGTTSPLSALPLPMPMPLPSPSPQPLPVPLPPDPDLVPISFPGPPSLPPLPTLPADWCDRWGVERRPPLPARAPGGALLRRHLLPLSIELAQVAARDAGLRVGPEALARLVALEEPPSGIPGEHARWIRNLTRALRFLAWDPSASTIDVTLLRSLRWQLSDGVSQRFLQAPVVDHEDHADHADHADQADHAALRDDDPDHAHAALIRRVSATADPLRQAFMLLAGLMPSPRRIDRAVALLAANAPLVRANLHPLLLPELPLQVSLTDSASLLRLRDRVMSGYAASCERFRGLYGQPWRRDPFRTRHQQAWMRMTHIVLLSGMTPSLDTLRPLAPTWLAAAQRDRLARAVLADLRHWLEGPSVVPPAWQGGVLALGLGISDELLLSWRARVLAAHTSASR